MFFSKIQPLKLQQVLFLGNGKYIIKHILQYIMFKEPCQISYSAAGSSYLTMDKTCWTKWNKLE